MDNKERKTEKRIMLGLLGIMTITTIIDLVTAVRLPILDLLEVNPIFMMFGSVWPILVLNVLAISIIFWYLKKSLSLKGLFFACLLVLYVSIMHLYGAYSNVYMTNAYYEAPDIVTEQAKEITAQDKISFLTLVSLFLVYIPMLIAYIAFAFTLKIYKLREGKRAENFEKAKRLINKL